MIYTTLSVAVVVLRVMQMLHSRVLMLMLTVTQSSMLLIPLIKSFSSLWFSSYSHFYLWFFFPWVVSVLSVVSCVEKHVHHCVTSRSLRWVTSYSHLYNQSHTYANTRSWIFFFYRKWSPITQKASPVCIESLLPRIVLLLMYVCMYVYMTRLLPLFHATFTLSNLGDIMHLFTLASCIGAMHM